MKYIYLYSSILFPCVGLSMSWLRAFLRNSLEVLCSVSLRVHVVGELYKFIELRPRVGCLPLSWMFDFSKIAVPWWGWISIFRFLDVKKVKFDCNSKQKLWLRKRKTGSLKFSSPRWFRENERKILLTILLADYTSTIYPNTLPIRIQGSICPV